MNLEQLTKFNAHWQTGAIRPSEYFMKRKLYTQILEELDSRFIQTISGVRRTGKSVLQEQLVFQYATVKNSLPAKNVLKVSFENEGYNELLPNSILENVLDLYFRSVLNTHPQLLDQKVIIAIDEIQNIEYWQKVVKTYYDLNPNIKFLLTGSSSLFLQKDSESLAGRILNFDLPCLDFEEFLMFSGSSLQLPFSNLLEVGARSVIMVTQEMLDQFETFLLIGGFPDTALMYSSGKSMPSIQEFIAESIIKRVVQKDLLRYFGHSSSIQDLRLFEICCADSGSFLEYENIAKDIGISAATVSSHINAFCLSGLSSLLRKFDKKLRREIRATKKVYVASPSIMASVLSVDSREDRAFVGHAVENYLFNRLSNVAKKLYVLQGRRNEEVDFYLPDQEVLIESKYSSRLNRKDFNLLATEATKQAVTPIIASYNTWEFEQFNCIPAMLI